MKPRSLVAVRLAGGSDLEYATAGKPYCYKAGWIVRISPVMVTMAASSIQE
jgi:hypothetical protein